MHYTQIEHEKLRRKHSLVVFQKLCNALFHLACGSSSVSSKGSSASPRLWRPLAHAAATGKPSRAVKISGPKVNEKRYASNEMSGKKQDSSGKPRISISVKARFDSRDMVAMIEGHFTGYMVNDPRIWK